jgi:hypothetical protein
MLWIVSNFTSNNTRTEMTATLQEQAQQTITDSVLKHTQALCEALTQNYIDYSIRSHQRSIERGENVEYHQQRIDELKVGKCDYSYIIESGRKYHKIIMVIDNGPDRSPSRSVHAFVDKNTGSVLKSASWKAPAKGERYNLLIIKDREYLLKNAGWSGSYLYAK